MAAFDIKDPYSRFNQLELDMINNAIKNEFDAYTRAPSQELMQDMQQPQMQHPNPMINMSGMNMSQMMGAQPQNQNMPPPNMPSPMGNPNMRGAMPMAPMGTPMPSQPAAQAPVGRGMMGAMNALNAQRPTNANVDPRMQKMNQMKQMLGKR